MSLSFKEKFAYQKRLLEIMTSLKEGGLSFLEKFAMQKEVVSILDILLGSSVKTSADAAFVKVLQDIIAGKYYDIEEIDRLLDKVEEEAKRLGAFDDAHQLFLDAAHKFNDILREAA